MNTHPPDTLDDTGASEWLSVSDAAARLGVSAKTLRKRMARGEVAFRRVVLARGGAAYEVEMESVLERSKTLFQNEGQTARNGSRNGTPLSVNRGEMEVGLETKMESSKPTSKPMPRSSISVSKTALEMESEVARLRADLERERENAGFLRGVIESDRRDMAEIRAALREALKLAPKQLAQGTEQSARNAPERAQNMEVDRNGSAALNGPQTGAKSLSYGDIADELERMLT